MSAKKVNNTINEIFIYVFLLLTLLLVSINIGTYLHPKQTKVLGDETQNMNEIFWQDFLSKNPDYIPGWIEIGDIGKANSINPNYLKP